MGSKEKQAEQGDQDDFVPEEENKNWKGIMIAILVISSIVSLIVMAIMILTPAEGIRINQPRISLEDIISDHFKPDDFGGSWISDGALIVLDVLKNSSSVLVSNTTFRQLNVKKFHVSADRNFVLLVHDIRKVYENSFTAKYKILNVSNEHVFPVEVAQDGGQEMQYAAWGPRGSQLLFIYQSNIYYIEKLGEAVRQLTRNGVPDGVTNGIPDWLYDEKILHKNHAVWFSPEGSKLAFASFNDTLIRHVVYPKYGSYDDPNNIYPEVTRIRYPQAGQQNPRVSLWIYDLMQDAVQEVQPPSEIRESEHYFASLVWIDEKRITASWITRSQNYSVFSLCQEERKWNCDKQMHDRLDEESVGWLEPQDEPIVGDDKRFYLLRVPVNEPGFGSFRQIAMIGILDKVKNILTQGPQDVTRIVAYKNHTAFYEATPKDRSGERHIYSIPDINSENARIAFCFTCDLPDTNCSYFEAKVSPFANFYALRCLGPVIPFTEIRSIASNDLVFRSCRDSRVSDIVQERAFPQFKTLSMQLENKFVADVTLILPPVLRESEGVRYPLVLEVASEPGTQAVTKRLTVDWGLSLSSRRDIIYARIDVRGSRSRGDRVLHETWRRLGSPEAEDYLQVMARLKSDLDFVDPKRTAIWGTAYGGFVAATVLAHERNSFNCALAVAPVTNWLLADSFTSERYFGDPWKSANMFRYEKSDLTHKAADFRDKNLMLVHGTADGSVLLQNTFAFMKSLNDAGVIYKSQIYPDSNHFFGDVKYHLYRSMESYLLDCFKMKDSPMELPKSSHY